MFYHRFTRLPNDPLSPLSSLDFPNSPLLKYHEPLARISAAYIQELFQRKTGAEPFFPPNTYLSLPFFIAYALSQSPLDASVNAASLNLLYRYKTRTSYRQIKLRDPSRLYIAAYLVAAKIISDKIYPMRTWASLAQNNYDITELADMEREFCTALNWDLKISDEVLDSLNIAVEAFLSVAGAGTTRGGDSPITSTTPDLGYSDPWPTESPFQSPISRFASESCTMEDDWIRIQEDLDRSRENLTSINSKIAELEDEYRCLLHSMSPSHNFVGPAKPSLTKRLSNLFQGGVSLLKRN